MATDPKTTPKKKKRIYKARMAINIPTRALKERFDKLKETPYEPDWATLERIVQHEEARKHWETKKLKETAP